ncbi:hypothetical protein CAPTEDRAFT_207031 [Capitella teleta]|uniref:Uncharacterized protein n=1 Tax=Capitella teleta TaxID=283909 RepID=R7US35_CAPTE|nr:hypothetical protein CAPTEDRAFT_207031 [Capitella teleta]|eukprot:ELU08953.1 hypothetical protein CAPTEDRAFT_207031 [Capitella teleta]
MDSELAAEMHKELCELAAMIKADKEYKKVVWYERDYSYKAKANPNIERQLRWLKDICRLKSENKSQAAEIKAKDRSIKDLTEKSTSNDARITALELKVAYYASLSRCTQHDICTRDDCIRDLKKLIVQEKTLSHNLKSEQEIAISTCKKYAEEMVALRKKEFNTLAVAINIHKCGLELQKKLEESKKAPRNRKTHQLSPQDEVTRLNASTRTGVIETYSSSETEMPAQDTQSNVPGQRARSTDADDNLTEIFWEQQKEIERMQKFIDFQASEMSGMLEMTAKQKKRIAGLQKELLAARKIQKKTVKTSNSSTVVGNVL